VVAIDPVTTRVRWRRPLEGAARGTHATLAGDTLVLAAGETLLGLDLSSGDVQWTQELPGHALDVGESLGQAVALVQYASVMQRTALVAVDPLSGAISWTRELSGGPAGRMLAGDDGVAVTRRRQDPSGSFGALGVSLHSGLTGEPIAEIPRLFDGWTDGSPRILDGKTVVGVTRGSDGLRLDAYLLATGKLVWSTPIPGPSGPLQRQLHVRGAQAVLLDLKGSIRTFDLASGNAVGETAVTGGLMFLGPSRSVTVLDDRIIALIRSGPGRGVIAAFDRRTGRSLWTKDALRDAQGVSQGILLDGGSSVVAVLSPARPILIRPQGGIGQPPDYQIVVLAPSDGADLRFTSLGLGEFLPSATITDGTLVIAGRRKFSVYR
jgi:outer membrane protein assembly factor BamB